MSCRLLVMHEVSNGVASYPMRFVAVKTTAVRLLSVQKLAGIDPVSCQLSPRWIDSNAFMFPISCCSVLVVRGGESAHSWYHSGHLIPKDVESLELPAISERAVTFC